MIKMVWISEGVMANWAISFPSAFIKDLSNQKISLAKVGENSNFNFFIRCAAQSEKEPNLWILCASCTF